VKANGEEEEGDDDNGNGEPAEGISKTFRAEMLAAFETIRRLLKLGIVFSMTCFMI